ncbi:hypothetical protein OPV22_029290 [Ensete ventricosum]|uniref:Homeobox domain-containing protein n=1 Tax=Ensete ventricosum TaxID=4639 RepID=A0AAV8Q8S5_ENSVE|nr:hypothetical protein OPV22_029290 [Ensete ventricosum]
MPEQLMILGEIYRSWVRTPSASQIEKTVARLSSYGRIEGKNVFYFFQNHKARERQKLQRTLSRHYQLIYSCHSLPHQQLYCKQGLLLSLICSTMRLQLTRFFRFSTRIQLYFFRLIRKSQNGGLNLPEISNAEEPPETNYETFGHEWTSMMMLPNRSSLRTLDLFPTTSTGLKDECATPKSSSSTSIN